jgi:hypothetical protein
LRAWTQRWTGEQQRSWPCDLMCRICTHAC